MRLFNLMSTAFDRYDETVKSYLSRTFGNLGMEYTHSQIFGVIFDGLKGVMQNAMFYIEDALTEQNIYTATRQKSVYSLAKLSGYEPYYGSAASGTVLGKINANLELPNSTTKLYISNYSRMINNKTGLSYVIVLPTDYYVVDLSKPIITHEFKLVQGRLERTNYISRGYPWEVIHIDTNELWDKNYFEVYVNGEKYYQQTSIYDMSENGKEYVINTGFDGTIEVMFGNGNYGKMLNNGDNVECRFIKHVGITGNVSSNSNSSFTMITQGSDSVGNSVNVNGYMSFTLQNDLSGGTNSDSTGFIRSVVGYNSRSLVLASEDNFKLFFKRFSFVGYVNCWSEKNSLCITATCLSNKASDVTSVEEYYNINTKDLLLSDDQKEMITSTLSNSGRSFAGMTLKFQDPIIRRYAIICYVKVDNPYNKDITKLGIETTLANYFMKMFSDVTFIAKSELIKRILDENSTIKSIDIDIISELAEQTYRNGYYNKYELKLINGVYKYVPVKVMYEPSTSPGLDNFGNIQLNSKLEIPVLNGGFRYYIDKSKHKNVSDTNYVNIDTVQVYFV